jgi:hypothetical protein
MSSRQVPEQVAASHPVSAAEPEQHATAEPEQHATVEPEQRPGPETVDVVALAVKLAKGTQWPGGALGLLGAGLILMAVVFEEFSNRLASAEFVAILTVGALLALAGPLVIAYTTTAARRAAVELGVTDKQALTAEKEAKTEEDRRRGVEAQLRIEELRREKPPSARRGA